MRGAGSEESVRVSIDPLPMISSGSAHVGLMTAWLCPLTISNVDNRRERGVGARSTERGVCARSHSEEYVRGVRSKGACVWGAYEAERKE